MIHFQRKIEGFSFKCPWHFSITNFHRHIFYGILYIKATMSICLSVCPGPETQIPKKTHTFSFQVSRNEGSVCLGTWRQEVSSDNEETWIWSRRYRNLKICNGSRGGDSRSQEMRGLSVLGTWRPIYRHMTRRFQVSKISRPGVWN